MGLELAFLALLAVRAGEEEAGAAGELENFWRTHVPPWIPAFASRMRAEARHPVFIALAEALEAAVG